MIKQKHLVLTSEVYFKILIYFIQILLFLVLFHIDNSFSQEVKNKNEVNINNTIKNFPAVVIDMKKVLSKSTAWMKLQKDMQKIESDFKSDIEKEENDLKKEQENLVAQKSVLSDEQFKEKQNIFRGKVNKTQTKIEGIRRELESTMAKGMQIIQNEAIKHLKKIAAKEGYLLIFDASSTVIAADKINISDIVAEKLNGSLPSIKIDRNEEKKGDK
tara:strand:+ start:326 stop:973 length:648 start_codon:yes stop_codon:yes gene_type:complete